MFKYSMAAFWYVGKGWNICVCFAHMYSRGLSLVKTPRREAEAKSACYCLSPLFLHVCAHTDAWSDYRGAPKSCVTCVQSTVTVKGTVPATYWCVFSINCNSKMLCYCLM